jgi:hypothetical protein
VKAKIPVTPGETLGVFVGVKADLAIPLMAATMAAATAVTAKAGATDAAKAAGALLIFAKAVAP